MDYADQSLIQTLTQKVELLEKTLRLTHIGGWEWDIREKKMSWTDETYRIHELDQDEIKEKGDDLITISVSCYLPEYRPLILDAFTKCCTEGTPYDLVLPLVTAKGRPIWIQTIGNPVYDHGSIVKASGNIIDITEQKQKDESQHYSEMKFRTIMEQAAEMLFLHDLKGTIIEVNRASVRQTGYSVDELLSMTIFDIDPDAINQSYTDNLWKNLKLGEKETFEVIHKRKDGTLYPAEITAGKIVFRETEYILAIAKDITHRKEAEEALRQSEQNAKAIIAAIPDMIFQMDAKGVFLNYKASREDLFTGPEKFLGQKINTVLPENLARLTLEKINTTLASNDLQIYEYELGIPEQGVMQFECRMVPYSNQEVVAIVRNITEQRKLEELIREKEARYRTLIENQGEGIGIVDKNEKFIFANPAAEEIFEVPQGNLLNRSLMDFIAPEYISTIERESANRAMAGKTSYEIAIITQAGHRREILLTATPQFDEKKEHIGAFGVFRDITERKKAEERVKQSEESLREMNVTKDKFFSIIAHDLKGPFNSILGLTDLLLQNYHDLDGDMVEKSLQAISGASNQAYTLLENLLLWSRTQTGRVEYLPEVVYLNQMIQETIRLLKIHVNKKQLHLVINTPGDLTVFADRNMIDAILRNLLSNAIKFTPRNGKIVISAIQQNDQIEVSVVDSGVGITPENIEKIFRISDIKTTPGTEKEKGSGLGLILCKEFVETHGGHIWVESNVGEGSTFRFTIPFSTNKS